MTKENGDCEGATDLERVTQRLGAAFAPRFREAAPFKISTGFMVWDDDEYCIYVDFYGELAKEQKNLLASNVLEVYHTLNVNYSIRVGFHQSAVIARQTMDEWFAISRTDENEK